MCEIQILFEKNCYPVAIVIYLGTAAICIHLPANEGRDEAGDRCIDPFFNRLN
jgi:hypothetical protein